MPGYDGTGPRGLGPMTGCSRGYCVLDVSRTFGEGFRERACLEGKPLLREPGFTKAGKVSLSCRVQRIQLELDSIERRIATLEITGQDRGGPGLNAGRGRGPGSSPAGGAR